ncbi:MULTISPECIES: glycosyltransferase [unclassified Providencia]|uniref:glycosyltransferase n=1 Tax=unclassified Providencia TaxID=2633465 RepID=UPI00234AD539|nr:MULTISPECIES: glycosyltransferase [unclassified Providencia]HEM8181790.1 glycosyltransferase [Providencia rettgeri]
MKSILIYLPNLNCGGAESVTVRLANFLANNGYSVNLITSLGGGVLEEILDKKIEYSDLNIKNQWFSIFKMPFVIRRTKPDIIFTTMKESCFIMILSKYFSFSNAKMIIREANTISLQLKKENKLLQKIKNRLIRFSYRYADKIIALSDEIKADLIQSFKLSKEIEVIPNPINFENIELNSNKLTDVSLNLNSNYLNLVTVARLHPQKNHLFMVEAVAKYIKDYGGVKWYLVGDGPLRAEIQHKADSLGISDNIIFLGFQKNPISIVNACDIFVLPSLYEGLSNALLEAAALNKKIIVSDTQTTSVALLNKLKTGTSYQNNNIDDFCEKLKALSTEPNNSETSKSMRATYSESSVFHSYMKLMDS